MIFGWLFGKKTVCHSCGSDKMGDKPGLVKMFIADFEEPIEKEICTKCCDILDADANYTRSLFGGEEDEFKGDL